MFYEKYSKYHDVYVPYAKDPMVRLVEHNRGSGGWTRHRGPWKLLHFEKFNNKTLALQKERWYKTGVGYDAIQELKRAFPAGE